MQIVLILRDVLLNINQSIREAPRLENIGIRFLADLALKLLPSVAYQIGLLPFDHFLFQPVLETIVVDVLARSSTLTRIE